VGAASDDEASDDDDAEDEEGAADISDDEGTMLLLAPSGEDEAIRASDEDVVSVVAGVADDEASTLDKDADETTSDEDPWKTTASQPPTFQTKTARRCSAPTMTTGRLAPTKTRRALQGRPRRMPCADEAAIDTDASDAADASELINAEMADEAADCRRRSDQPSSMGSGAGCSRRH